MMPLTFSIRARDYFVSLLFSPLLFGVTYLEVLYFESYLDAQRDFGILILYALLFIIPPFFYRNITQLFLTWGFQCMVSSTLSYLFIHKQLDDFFQNKSGGVIYHVLITSIIILVIQAFIYFIILHFRQPKTPNTPKSKMDIYY